MATNWQTIPLGKALTFQRGFDITKDEQREGPYFVISSSGPKSTHAEFKVRGPGVIIGRKGSLGTVFFSADDYWPHDTTLWIKDFHGNDPRFAYYFLHTMGFERLDAGASNPSLNRNHIHTIPVHWPPLPIQRRIAGVLSAYDQLIENCQRRIKVLESMARALYREWFVRFRFPGYEADALAPTSVGFIPARWSVKKLGEIAEITMGLSPKGDSYNEEGTGVPLVNGPVEFGERFTKRIKWTTSPTKLCKAGDLVVCVRGSTTGKFVSSDGVYCLGRGVCSLSSEYQSFVDLLFEHELPSLLSQTGGSTFPSWTGPQLKNHLVICPTSDVLVRFETLVSPMRAAVQFHSRQIEILRQTRELLLPRLVSGQIGLEEIHVQ